MDARRSTNGSSRRASLQRSRGQTLVASSDTFMRWLLPSSAKMLSGCSEEVGRVPFSGRLPSMIAGTALLVESYIECALRNQVPSLASRAKPG